MVAYVETLLLDNALMNILILYLTAVALRLKFKRWRVALSALCGAGIAIAALYLPALTGVVGKLAVSYLLIGLAFGFRGFKRKIVQLAAYYLVTFLLGGAALGLFFFLGKEAYLQNGAIVVQGFPVGLLAVSGIFVTYGIRAIYSYFAGGAAQKHYLYRVRATAPAGEMAFTALLDTGCTLREAQSGLPVIVVQKSAWPPGFDENTARARYVPFRSVGRDAGYLKAWRTDQITIQGPQGQFSPAGVYLAYYAGELCTGDRFQALMPPDVLAGAQASKDDTITLQRGGSEHEKSNGDDVGGDPPGAAAADAKVVYARWRGGTLHRRERGAALSAQARAGARAGQRAARGGPAGAGHADRAQSAAGGVHRQKI